MVVLDLHLPVQCDEDTEKSHSEGPRANRSLVFEPDLRGASNKTLNISIK